MRRLKLSSLELRRQLMLMVLIIFLPVVCILVLSAYRQEQSAVEAARQEVLHLIDSFEEDEREQILQTHRLLELLSQVPSIQNMDISAANGFLQNIHQYYPQYSTIVVSDPGGTINICAVPIDGPIDVGDRSWYKRVTETKGFVVDRFIISRSADRASLPFAYPVLNSDGSIKFILGAAFDISYFGGIFSGHLIPPDSEILLLDGEDTILYSSTDRLTVGAVFTEAADMQIPEVGEGRITARDELGIERYYWQREVPVDGASGSVRIIIGLSKKLVLAGVRKSILESHLLLTAVVLLSLSSVWLYSRRLILNPVNILLERTRKIRAWDLNQPDAIRNFPGELQGLADEIDILAATLRERDSEGRAAEQALKENEERMRILFDRAADDIYVSDASGRLIEVNSQAEKDTGYLKSELLEMNVWEIDAEQTTGEAISDFFDTLSPGHPVKIESRHRRKDGSVYPVEITIVKLETTSGTMIMGIARNISERLEWQENIKRTLADKEILLKELYHRTKNNMEVIRSMLNLNSYKYNIPEMNEIVTNTGNRIEAMSLVHQMLYQSEDLSKIDLGEYLSKLTESIIGGMNSDETEISIEINADRIDLIIDIAVPLGLVLNEIIMNSCKHAFRDRGSGKISISVLEDEKNISIILSDDGRGLPEGFIHDPAESLGMTIISGIVEHQLSGKIELDGSNGVTWKITFPREIYKNSPISIR